MICLIDVSGFIYRYFYALPNFKYNDLDVGALYGFCSSILKIQSYFEDAMFIAAFDSSRKTFRTEIYNAYKANRKETPESLISQIPLIKEACDRLGLKKEERLGFEADDIIASYVKKLHKEHEIIIFSSDKDLMQLIDFSNVKIYDDVKQKYITEDDVIKKFGVSSSKVLDVLSLMGDSSDNIPGISGIGPKTASSLINEFGSLENLIDNLDKLPKNKKYIKLKEEIEMAILSKKLATLIYDIDIDFQYKKSEHNEINEFFLKYGFKSLIKDYI